MISEAVTDVARAACCRHPVRLLGSALDRATGELSERRVLVACTDRREAVCPACAAVYQGDAFQLVASGLYGGKGVPVEVAEHPVCFLTLTAPSFGPVHRSSERPGRSRPCRPRRDPTHCPHGEALACFERHRASDARLGQPLCGLCFDYEGAVLWNLGASLLWQRTSVALRREVAALGSGAMTVLWRDVGMDHPPAPFVALRSHLAARSAGRAGKDALARLAAAGVPVGDHADPLRLALGLRAGDPPMSTETSVAGALLEIAGADEVAGLCLLVALEPELVSMTLKLCRLGIESQEAASRVLAACWAVMVEPLIPGEPRFFGGVASRTWSRVRGEVRRELHRRRRTTGIRKPIDPTQEPDALESARGLLADAQRAGVLTVEQTRLLYETRVLGRPVGAASVERGQSRQATWKARRRAEVALRSYLTGEPK